MSEIHARRADWRADLLDYTAAVMDGAPGLEGLAADKRAAAELHRQDAALNRELVDAKAADAAGRTPATVAALDDIKRRLRAFRQSYRESNHAVRIVNDFAEPSDEELAQAAGASS